MRRLGVADVRRAGVRLQLKQPVEVHGFALGAQLVRTLRRRVEKGLARQRHAPPGKRQLGLAIGIQAHDRRKVIGEGVARPRLPMLLVIARGEVED